MVVLDDSNILVVEELSVSKIFFLFMNLFSILHIPSIVVLVHVNVHVLKSPLERMSVDFEIP